MPTRFMIVYHTYGSKTGYPAHSRRIINADTVEDAINIFRKQCGNNIVAVWLDITPTNLSDWNL